MFAADVFDYREAGLKADADGRRLVLQPGAPELPGADFDFLICAPAPDDPPGLTALLAQLAPRCSADGAIALVVPCGSSLNLTPSAAERSMSEALADAARSARLQLAMLWQDERGPRAHHLAVLCRSEEQVQSLRKALQRPVKPVLEGQQLPPPGAPQDEACRGARRYLEVLQEIHARVAPEFYLEVGVRWGSSMRLARCPALGIDPYPALDAPLADTAQLAETTSDAWFRTHTRLPAIPDLAFIDGCHLFEFALRDFMNIERRAAPGSLIVIDDIYPNARIQARRVRATRAWTGDVWKLHDCLSRYRPDLWLWPLDTFPTGLLLVSALDPDNRTLWEQYGHILNEYAGERFRDPPAERLARLDARSPASEALSVLDCFPELRNESGPQRVARRLRAASLIVG